MGGSTPRTGLGAIALRVLFAFGAGISAGSANGFAQPGAEAGTLLQHREESKVMGFEHIEQAVRAYPRFDAGGIENAGFDRGRGIASVNQFLQAFLPPGSSDLLVTAGITSRGQYIMVERYDGTRWHDVGNEMLLKPSGRVDFNFNYALDDSGPMPVVRDIGNGQAFLYDGERFVAQ